MIAKASVILPCHNGTQWVGSAIESVLAQTYDNFELLIIDDGSTDNSEEIIFSYLNDKRLRYIHQENRGFSATINRGLRESKGDLVGFIGQDDLWLPEKLELQVKYFNDQKDTDLVHSSYLVIDPQGRVIGIRNTEILTFASKEKLIERLFLDNFIGFETVLVKKRCFEKVGFFDERMVGYSDHHMWLRIAGKFNIGYIGVPLVKKRLHEHQLSKLKTESVLKDEFLIAEEVTELYPFLKKVEQKRLASLYYTWGIALLNENRCKEAKKKFFKSIRCQPTKLRAIIPYFLPRTYKLLWNYYFTLPEKSKRRLKLLKARIFR